ncbi:hypothetical protein EDD80_108160 [Anseongella ginsenosidimutans]|uniref:DUF5683 domain-containing protein n=2 Tax=Anseongella ginsenosidimutans TaxID=496056 RepID=A0A4R3KQD6_9SPHI|nr:hypothetical protein EDD80_108160 [Anseongella ginsenosidimutans]
MLLIWAAPRLCAQDIDTLPAPETIPAGEMTVDTIPVTNTAAAIDTTAAPEASAAKKPAKDEREIALSSGKALLYSAIIPGGGQFYNGKYWKIPIVYGGFIALGIAIEFNQSYYSEFVRELNYRGDGDPLTVPKYDEEIIPNSRIIEARNYYRRYRDMCIIGVGVLYGLNIVDAYVDAELSNFDISEDLTMKVAPSLQFDPTFAAAGMGVAPGFSVRLAIR